MSTCICTYIFLYIERDLCAFFNIYLSLYVYIYIHDQPPLTTPNLSILLVFSRWQPPEKWIHGAAKAAVPSGTAKEVILENPLDVPCHFAHEMCQICLEGLEKDVFLF